MPHPNGNIILEVPTGCKHQRMQENNCEQQCGWRHSGIRTCLRMNSLLTGNFTGKFTISSLKAAILEHETAVLQGLFSRSLSELSGKFFQRAGNSKRITGIFLTRTGVIRISKARLLQVRHHLAAFNRGLRPSLSPPESAAVPLGNSVRGSLG